MDYRKLCIKMWEIMYDKGYLHKKFAIIDMGYKPSKIDTLCFACEYVDTLADTDKSCGELCPVDWDGKGGSCASPESPYNAWVDYTYELYTERKTFDHESFTKEEIDMVKELAGEVLKVIKTTWKEV